MEPTKLPTNRQELEKFSNTLEREVKDINEQIKGLQQEAKVKSKLLNQAKQKISQFDLQVSDHAVIRYFERATGMDVDLIKETLQKQLQPSYESLGNGKFPLGESTAVVKNGTVVTII